MDIFDANDRSRIIGLIQSPYYNEWMPRMWHFLRASRNSVFMSDPSVFASIQDEGMTMLGKFTQAIKQGKQELTMAKSTYIDSESKELEELIFANTELTRIIQMIFDGLAFRMLSYNHPFVRLMVQPQRPAASVEYTKVHSDMKKLALSLSEKNGSRIFFNDLTNILRVGDMTEFFPDGKIMLHELKRDGGKIINIDTVRDQINRYPNSKRSAQVNRLLVAQIASDSGTIIDDDDIPIVDIDCPFKNHLDLLPGLIRQARQYTYSSTTIGDYLYVRCMYLHAIPKSEPDKPQLNWHSSDRTIRASNWLICFLGVNDFARNSTPYSVFPLSTSDCLNLMSGHLFVETTINITAVMRHFTAWNWTVHPVSDEYLARYSQGINTRPPSSKTDRLIPKHEDVVFFSVSRGDYFMDITGTLLTRLANVLMDISMLVAEVEYMYFKRDEVMGRFVADFVSERKVWF